MPSLIEPVNTLTPRLNPEALTLPPFPVRTKVVATMGPAVAADADMRSLLSAGVDVCRLNFSHGELPDHGEMLAQIRRQADALDKRVAVLGDLGGPKIRVGHVDEDNPHGGLFVETGGELVIRREPITGRDGLISSTYVGLVDDVEVGDRLLIEDGLLRFVCVRKERDGDTISRIVLRCTAGGVIKTRKGINLPGTRLGLPSITDRDWACVDWAVANDLDYLALSFVRRADDIRQLRGRLDAQNSRIGIIAKIEKHEALSDIDAIIAASDGVMVARGDLGVEMDLARVPLIQKDLIARCRRAGKPAIVATQMLQSMVDVPSPTRAEVSDVANAIFDGTDATMLSGETSVGRFPVGSVHVMRHIADETERYLATHGGGPGGATVAPDGLDVTFAAARAVRLMLATMPCRLVVVYSITGDTARVFAGQRFDVPVVALTDDDAKLRQMSLHYGVLPLRMDRPANLQDLADASDALLLERRLVTPGDRIVLVAGRNLGGSGVMNGIVIHTVATPPEDPCAAA